MANPTTNFGWQMPTPTDLVTDLPADFEVFGQAVDTDLADLKGGTTGQILSKTSNTDLDFTWINNDQGDITGVTATAPLTGGGTSGAVTVGIDDATTSQKGAVQLENSTSSTSTTTAAVPASVKAAYDLANAAIPKTLTTTTGDIIYASAANTPARLGIGSSSQVLTVSGGVPAWTTLSSGGGLTLISQTSLSGTSVTLSSIPNTYKHLMLVFQKVYYNANDYPIQFRFNSDTGSNYTHRGIKAYSGAVNSVGSTSDTLFEANIQTRNASDTKLNMFATFNLYNYTTTTSKGFDFYSFWADSGGATGYTSIYGNYYNSSAISSITLIAATQSFSSGTAFLYGVS